jgi:hypothetical protein
MIRSVYKRYMHRLGAFRNDEHSIAKDTKWFLHDKGNLKFLELRCVMKSDDFQEIFCEHAYHK